jgi:hypothetical protein
METSPTFSLGSSQVNDTAALICGKPDCADPELYQFLDWRMLTFTSQNPSGDTLKVSICPHVSERVTFALRLTER